MRKYWLPLAPLVLLVTGFAAWMIWEDRRRTELDVEWAVDTLESAVRRRPRLERVLDGMRAALSCEFVVPAKRRELRDGELARHVVLFQGRSGEARPEPIPFRWIFSLGIDEIGVSPEPVRRWPETTRHRLPNEEQIRSAVLAALPDGYDLAPDRLDVIAREPGLRPAIDRVLVPRQSLRRPFFGVRAYNFPPLSFVVALTESKRKQFGRYSNGVGAFEATVVAHFFRGKDSSYLGTLEARAFPSELHVSSDEEWETPDVVRLAHWKLYERICAGHGHAPPKPNELVLPESVPLR